MSTKPSASATPTPAPVGRVRTRTASVTYPYHTLSTCLDLAKGVREIGNGKQEVSRTMLASHLNIDEKSGDFAQKLASTKTYGLIDGRTDFKLTDIARGLFFPTEDPERQKRLALLQAARSPGAFAALLDRYDGSKLPTQELMGNVLSQEFGIPESWKLRIATFFVKSMQLSGALTQDGFLRHKAELQKISSGSNPEFDSDSRSSSDNGGEQNDDNNRSANNKRNDDQQNDGGDQMGVIVWKYPFKGKTLRIETPEDITPEIWNKLKRYIDVLNPNE